MPTSKTSPFYGGVDPLNINTLKNDEIARIRSISLQFLAFFLFAIGTTYISDLNEKEDKKLSTWGLLTTSFVYMWTFMGGGFLMAKFFQDPPTELYRLLVPYFPKKMRSKDYLKFEKTLASYLEMRDSLSADDRNTMDNAIKELRERAVGWGDPQEYIGKPTILASTINYLNMIITINDSKNRIGIDKAELPILTKKLDQIFSTYPHVKETLMSYLRALISSDLIKAPNRPRPLFFVGAPGVGKTVLAHTLFKELNFNVHVIPISELIEKPRRDYSAQIYHTFDIQQASPFVQAIHKSAINKGGSKYTVIIIDEIDKLLRVDGSGELSGDYPELITKFLELSDPNKRYFHDTSIKANLDMQFTLIVFLANKNIFAKSPMARRLLLVIFPPIPISLKITISNNKISEMCQELQLSLKPEEQQYLDNLIKSNDKEGVGELLEDIKNFLENLRSVSVFENTSWQLSSQAMLAQYNAQVAPLQQEAPEPLIETTILSADKNKPPNNNEGLIWRYKLTNYALVGGAIGLAAVAARRLSARL
jgi:hypothetical protein